MRVRPFPLSVVFGRWVSRGCDVGVSACLDDGVYPTGVKVTDDELAAVPLFPHDFHGEWNYMIGCGRSRKPRRTNKSLVK